MTSPLYSVGQSVAVFSMPKEGCECGLDVLPNVAVAEAFYLPLAWCACGLRYPEGWYYTVTPDPGVGCFAENELRPINPDTEYLTDSAPQKLEQPCD